MGRQDRRHKLALDESFRYYRSIDSGEAEPSIFELTKSLGTLSTALAFAQMGEFKLTRQLWKRLQQAMFDKLLTTFAGEIVVLDADGRPITPGGDLPEDGLLEFHPDRCHRAEDHCRIEIGKLYPKTIAVLQKLWAAGKTSVSPMDFDGYECEGGLCPMRPLMVGQDVLVKESLTGKDAAYNRWWELYWQAYCSDDEEYREEMYKQMGELEAVWGDLYY